MARSRSGARGAHRSNVFVRALSLLAVERRAAWSIAAASMIVGLLQVAEPLLFGSAVNALARGADPLRYVGMWSALSFTVFAAGIVVALTADRLVHRRRLAAMANFVEHLLALPPSFHTEARSGRMLRVLSSGTDALFNLWLPVLRDQLTNIVCIAALLPVAMVLNWRLAIVLVALMGAYVAVAVLVARKTSLGQKRVEENFTNVSGHVGDLFGNVSVLQSFLAVPGELSTVRGSLQQVLAAQYPVLNWWAVANVLTKGASSLSIVIIFATGAWLAAHGQASVGDIVSFIGFATLLIGRCDQLTGFFMRTLLCKPTLELFFGVLDQESAIVERADARPLQVTHGHVRFEHVSFRYPSGSGAVHDLTFEARPGETVAIVGSTGSGKSTAMGLFQRAYDPERGRILIDGQDIREVTLPSLRASTGVVFQEAGLFNRTIAENIAMGNPAATPEQIEDAARLAGAYDFIMRREGGFQSPVGDRGQGLSGGERQRIAIARALLKNAPILLLDEATSALDVETEAKLQVSLDRLRAGRTTFVIAHRLSTIRAADRIIVLEQGRIAETGTFEDLVAAGGVFAKLAQESGIVAASPPASVSHRLAA